MITIIKIMANIFLKAYHFSKSLKSVHLLNSNSKPMWYILPLFHFTHQEARHRDLEACSKPCSHSGRARRSPGLPDSRASDYQSQPDRDLTSTGSIPGALKRGRKSNHVDTSGTTMLYFGQYLPLPFLCLEDG